VYIDKFDQLDEALVQALQTGCDMHAPGIEIIAVRVTKPRIPETIRKNYEDMEKEKTKLLIASQRQLVALKEQETLAKKEVIEAQKRKRVAEITARKHISEKEAEAEMAAIEDQVYIDSQKALADAELYTAKKDAEANKLLLSPEYLQEQHILSLKNSKLVLGDKIPSTLLLPGMTSSSSSSSGSSDVAAAAGIFAAKSDAAAA